MGAKSRGNYKLGLCLRFSCLNRDKECNACANFSNYKEIENEESKTLGEENRSS